MRVARVNDNTIIDFSNYGVTVLGVKDEHGVWQVSTYLGTIGEAQAIDELTNGEPVVYTLVNTSAKTAIKFLTKLGRTINIVEGTYGDKEFMNCLNAYNEKVKKIVTQ